MKYFVYSVFAFALISAGITISYSHTDNTQSVSIRIDDPERAAESVGSVITELGKTIQSFAEQENACKDSVPEPEKVFYRVRDLKYDPASQIGSFDKYENAICACIPGYCVYNQNGTLLYANAPD